VVFPLQQAFRQQKLRGCGNPPYFGYGSLYLCRYGKETETVSEHQGRKNAVKSNPKLTALQVELAQVQHEIETLIDTLTGANPVLLSYVNSKIEELDERKQKLVKKSTELSVETVSPEQVKEISGYLDTWDEVDFEDKRRVVDLMITTIAATSDSLNITWKI